MRMKSEKPKKTATGNTRNEAKTNKSPKSPVVILLPKAGKGKKK
jgi:hypothetical protein